MRNWILYLTMNFLFFSINIIIVDAQGKSNNSYPVLKIDTHPKNWKNSEISSLLKKGKVISICPMKSYLHSRGKKTEFDGEVFFVELDNGLKVVFKSLPKDDLGDAYAEVAAYQASIILGFPTIPPTIMTEIEDMKGSLQLFVETDIDALNPGLYELALKEADREDVANLHLFYFVFGQWDSGPHNILIFKEKEKTSLIAIDNSGVHNRQHVEYGKLPFIRMWYSDKFQTNDWDKPFPFDQAKTIKNPTIEKLKKIFGDKAPKSFYTSFKAYKFPFRYVIYQNSLWRQFHAGDKSFIMSFSNYLPDQTRKALEELDLTILKKIFACAKNEEFLMPVYLKAILERRDQVLQHFKK